MLTDREVKEELHALASSGVGDGYVSALLTFGGSLCRDEKGEYLSYSTHDYRLAWELASYLADQYRYHAEVHIVDPGDKRRNRVYCVEIRGRIGLELLSDLGKAKLLGGKIVSLDLGVKPNLPATQSVEEYVRGVYLSVGSISRAAEGLRLELTFELETDADAFAALLQREGVTLGKSGKSGRYVLATRKGETISDFFIKTGASKIVFVLQDMLVKKLMENKTARAGNLLLANTDKSVSAAIRQYEDAVTIRDGTGGFIGVPKEIREVAEARIERPDASIAELVAALPGKITKSGLYHRLQKMHDLAEKIREERK
ncbi:MAG: DNA-binding protein WhiA [Clostridia bacterium]|nr:DNA-binding protein WhiA [Clostridia bacterium]